MSRLEDEIKQINFGSAIHKATVNIIFTANWIGNHNKPYFKKHNILEQHYNVLRIVRGRKGKPVSPGEIIEVMLDRGRDLTRLIDKLEKLGLLVRRRCENNKRKMEIFITERGLEVTAEIQESMEEDYTTWFKLTDDEAEQLNLLLDKMRG